MRHFSTQAGQRASCGSIRMLRPPLTDLLERQQTTCLGDPQDGSSSADIHAWNDWPQNFIPLWSGVQVVRIFKFLCDHSGFMLSARRFYWDLLFYNDRFMAFKCINSTRPL
ncbi:Hypothetical predicted protein [Cloeon dipterum]|uniref:Uncharacterized protein n=1 Tax=Cloeon dipterum TaxID=197152 RepID=A0A8S1CNG8_9INSE|nr:Hypothetical predicted protein [Cloeon dipterum]